MNNSDEPKWDVLARRYRLDEQTEWHKLLAHFDLAQGFDLVVLLVPEADGATLCRHELEQYLAHENRALRALELTTPEALNRLPEHFLEATCDDNTALLWVEAVAPDYTPDYAQWRAAWENALARLNAFRNPIRERFQCTLVFVGAPWLGEVMREIAPDLWSVRTFVARIETAPQRSSSPNSQTGFATSDQNSADSPDPEFALQYAEKLRGVTGKELELTDMLHRAGEGFASRHDWRRAEKSYAEALEIKQNSGATPESQLATLNELCYAYLTLGQVQRSLDLAEQQVALAREVGDRSNEGNALCNLGNAYECLGDARHAIESYEQALVISREIEDRSGEGSDLGNLGIAYSNSGETQRAIELYEEQLAISREMGDRRGEGRALGNLGNAYSDLGETRRAIELYEQQLDIVHETGDRRGEGTALGNLGNAYESLGDTPRAIEFHEQALVISREIGDRRGEGSDLGNLGNAYWSLREIQRAVEFYEQALVISREIGDRRSESKSLWNLSLALNELAIQQLESALEIYEEIESPQDKIEKARRLLTRWRDS